MHVLVVEADELTRARTMVAFLTAGHTVDGVAGADAALAALRRGAFDMLLVDPFAPGGWNLALLPTARITAPSCRVVLLTDTDIYTRGELFALVPHDIAIVQAPIRYGDLVILCAERAVRPNENGGARNGGTAAFPAAHP